MEKCLALLSGAFAASAGAANADSVSSAVGSGFFANTNMTSVGPQVLTNSQADIAAALQAARSSSHLTSQYIESPRTEYAFERLNSGVRHQGSFDRISVSLERKGWESATTKRSKRRIRADVRIDDFVSVKNTAPRDGWYLFAATDGESLAIKPTASALSTPMKSMTLDDQVTIGDVQAGIARYKWGAEMTISFMQRESSFSGPRGESISISEDFVGFSVSRLL